MPSSALLKTINVTFQNELWLRGEKCTFKGQTESRRALLPWRYDRFMSGHLRTKKAKRSLWSLGLSGRPLTTVLPPSLQSNNDSNTFAAHSSQTSRKLAQLVSIPSHR